MLKNCRVISQSFPLLNLISNSVLHERSKEYYKQDNAKEYAYITADEYNPQQLIDMEKEILNLLGFNLVAPNAMHFLKIYIALFQIPDNVAVIASVNIIFLQFKSKKSI